MYAIMRSKKHKIGGGLAAALQHMYRERETPNSDPTIKNKVGKIANTKESLQLLHSEIKRSTEATGRKMRKDAVVAVEYVFSASPEFWDDSDEQIKKFTSAVGAWLDETYKDGKIIAVSVHLDETTPHLSVFITPTTFNDKNQYTFNARKFLGGKKLLSKQQDTFAKAVEHLGLKRGIKGSKATHQQVNRFYTNVLLSDEQKKKSHSVAHAKIKENAGLMGSKKALVELASELADELLDTKNSVSAREIRRLKAENARLLEREKNVEKAIAEDIENKYLDELRGLQRAFDDRVKALTVADKTIRQYEKLISRIDVPPAAWYGLAISPKKSPISTTKTKTHEPRR